MRTRELKGSDIPLVREWLARRGFDYEFPDLTDARIVHAEVMVDDNDAPVSAIFGVKTVEMYFLSDPDWETPRKRLLALQIGHESFRKWLHEHGWPDVFAVLPPKVAKSFGRRLTTLFGWIEGRWNHYSRKTAGEQ